LLLDNCEHLLNACAVLMRTLLRACPSIKILATSREALGIGGEQIYRVPSLSVPDSKQPCTPDTVSQFEAVRLFIERARLVKPEFDVTHQDASPLAHICSRLEGIALAIELAAARVRSLTVEDIHDRLDQRFRLLTGGDRTALPRQQTLRALIDWSYDLLNNQERILFARISVFAGGCTLAAAEHVCSDEGTADVGIDKWEVINLLTSLADKSLVIAEERAGSARYRLLETVRQYAAERLQARGEMIELCNRHRDWCVALAEEAAPHLYDADQVRWLDCLEGEHDNRPFPRYSTLFPLQWRPQVANASITDRP
jgi:non-specific serine/threonine protein kinase